MGEKDYKEESSVRRIAFCHQSTGPSSLMEELTADDVVPASQPHPPLHESLTTQIYDSQYGKRSIGTIGGICLLVNNCLGPGLVQMNGQMQLSGWLPVVAATVVFGALAFASSWMLLYAQSHVRSSLSRVEFTGICEYFFPRKLFLFSILFYILTMIVQCISGIQQTTQLMDLLIVRLFGKTCALEVYPSFMGVPCGSDDNGGFSVFTPGSGVLSLGYIAAGVIAIPFGFFPLEDSIIFQIVSCAVMAVCIVLLGVDLGMLGYEPSRLPAVGSSMSGLVGLMMFNFSLAFSLPSWNNERRLAVRVKRSIGASIGIGSVTMILIGALAAMAFAPVLGSAKNLIDFANDSNRPLTLAAVYVFSLANNVTTIPVFSIMIRYTLLEHKVIRRPWIANLLAILLPWLLVIPFSTGSGFDMIIDFGGSIFIGVTCFVAPPVLFICALRPKWLFRGATETPEKDAEADQANSEERVHELADEQFPPIRDQKRVDLLSIGSFAILGALMGSLGYSWYSSVS